MSLERAISATKAPTQSSGDRAVSIVAAGSGSGALGGEGGEGGAVRAAVEASASALSLATALSISPLQASKTPRIVWSSTIGNKPRSRAYPSNRVRFVVGAAMGEMSAQKPRFRDTWGLGATSEAIARPVRLSHV
jgi:hypothetical protein